MGCDENSDKLLMRSCRVEPRPPRVAQLRVQSGVITSTTNTRYV